MTRFILLLLRNILSSLSLFVLYVMCLFLWLLLIFLPLSLVLSSLIMICFGAVLKCFFCLCKTSRCALYFHQISKKLSHYSSYVFPACPLFFSTSGTLITHILGCWEVVHGIILIIILDFSALFHIL